MNEYLTEERIEKLTRLRVLVVGDLMLDAYIQGSVERTSPEAPVLVVQQKSERHLPGGAGNVACNLAAFGCRTALAGVIGRDDAGRTLKGILKERRISAAAVHATSSRPTTVKTRVLAGSQQVLRIDREERTPLSPSTAGKLLTWIERNIKRFDGLILSDYNKGVLSPRLLRAIIACAQKAKKPIVVDPKGQDFKKYRGVTAIKPNLSEAQLATGITIDSPQSAERAARKLAEIVDCRTAVVTRGPEGLTLYDAEQNQATHIPAIRHEVFDVGGAGDTFAVFFSLGLFAGWPSAEAARLGNIASGIVVQRIGMATVSPLELRQALLQSQPSGQKLQTLDEMAALAAELRRRGKRVVFTNGCFDLLHAGHIQFLERSRAAGDCLIVGLNTDRAVRRLKGPGRPCLNEAQRASLIAALACVDYVVFFDEDTPEKALRAIRPDLLTQGGNYQQADVIGRQLVERHGGAVKLIPLEEDITTGQLIERIRAKGESEQE